MSTKGKYIIPIMELLHTKRGRLEKPVPLTKLACINCPPKPGVQSLLFCYVCFVSSDFLLKWSKKNGFYTSCKVIGGLWSMVDNSYGRWIDPSRAHLRPP